LNKVKLEIVELASDADRLGIAVQDIPSVVERPDSSMPKLVDEYYWITIANEFKVPSSQEIERRTNWCQTHGLPTPIESVSPSLATN